MYTKTGELGRVHRVRRWLALGVQDWMALDLWMALGRDDTRAPKHPFSAWAEMLHEVRAGRLAVTLQPPKVRTRLNELADVALDVRLDPLTRLHRLQDGLTSYRTIPGPCAVLNPDDPRLTCTRPVGHAPVEITDYEDDVSTLFDHADPDRGAYWNVIRDRG
jgi:hypothetical protein